MTLSNMPRGEIMDTKLVTLAYAAPTKWVNTLCKDMKSAGYRVERDNSAGTVIGYLDDDIIFRALQMGRAWLVRGNPEVFKPVN